ncbi:MAG: hypothetical protein OEZ54_07920 [Gemmatimonadota bacterium]|nr:hypothetical protein [Gemmatimonadota bacterium]
MRTTIARRRTAQVAMSRELLIHILKKLMKAVEVRAAIRMLS